MVESVPCAGPCPATMLNVKFVGAVSMSDPDSVTFSGVSSVAISDLLSAIGGSFTGSTLIVTVAGVEFALIGIGEGTVGATARPSFDAYVNVSTPLKLG